MADSLNDLERKMAEIAQRANERITATLVGTALAAEGIIADHIDDLDVVDTGRLKASFASGYTVEGSQEGDKIGGSEAYALSSDGLSAYVGTNVEYAVPVHDGYSREKKDGSRMVVQGRPFLQQAMPDIKRAYLDIAKAQLKGLTGG